jgi:hypothetical protein
LSAWDEIWASGDSAISEMVDCLVWCPLKRSFRQIAIVYINWCRCIATIANICDEIYLCCHESHYYVFQYVNHRQALADNVLGGIE